MSLQNPEWLHLIPKAAGIATLVSGTVTVDMQANYGISGLGANSMFIAFPSGTMNNAALQYTIPDATHVTVTSNNPADNRRIAIIYFGEG